MRINWAFTKNSQEKNNAFISFGNKKNTVIKLGNSKGKTLLLSEILFPLSINHDLNSETKKMTETIISISHNNEEIILRRYRDSFLAYWKNEKTFIDAKNKAELYGKIFNIFDIPFINNENSAHLFKSLFMPSTALQTTKINGVCFIQLPPIKDLDRVYYQYWANAFRDEFSRIKAIEELCVKKEKREELKKILAELEGKYKIISEIEDTDMKDRKIDELKILTHKINLLRKNIAEIWTEINILNQELSAIHEQKFHVESWTRKYKNKFVIINGIRFTISDFLSDFKVEDGKVLRIKKEEKIQQISTLEKQIKIKKSLFEDARKIIGKDYIFLKSMDTLELESKILNKKYELYEILKQIKDINALLKPKNDEKSLYDFMLNIDFISNCLIKRNTTGEYKDYKLKLKSTTGASSIQVFIEAQKAALNNKGIIAPLIYDSSDEVLDEENVGTFYSNLENNMKSSNQIIFFTNKNFGSYFKSEEWFIYSEKEIRGVEKQIPDRIKGDIEKVAM